MTSPASGLDPPRPLASARIRAMESMIRAGLESITADTRPRSASESLLFMGNWHDANPRLLICDPVLEPVDKIVYQVIRQDVSPQHGTSFPSYQQIATAANIASDATVARAIAILRVTRWLTLCAKARDAHGRFRGSVYALHDEPLPLPDTLALDPEYMAFLHQMRAHKHARVRDIANAFLTSLEADIQAGRDVTAPTDALQVRQESTQFVSQLRQGLDIRALRFNGFAGDLVGDLLNRPAAEREEPPHGDANQLQNLKLVESSPLQNLKTESQQQNLLPQNLRPQNLPAPCSSSSSSSFIKTTTTTTSAHARASSNPSPPLSDLVCPQNLLSANERHLAQMHLQRVRPERRQAILDVLVHRLQNGELRSPIGYLCSLVERERIGSLADLRPPPEAGSAAAGEPSPRDEVAERVASLHQEIHSIRSFIQRLKGMGLGNNPSLQQQTDHHERLKREEQRLSAALTEIRGLLQQRPDLLAAGNDARTDESRQ